MRVDGRGHHVSLSRSGPHLITVISAEPVGVDVESVAAVAARWDPALVLAAGERSDTDEERARTWARKEAVLKRRGSGLATPMTDVLLAAETWCDLPGPPGYVVAVSPGGLEAGAP